MILMIMRVNKKRIIHLFQKVVLVNICLSTLLFLFDKNSFASKAIPVRIKHLFAIDAQMSGTLMNWVDEIAIDNERDEIYMLDKSNNRIVITDNNGVYLSQIRYKNASINQPVTLNIDTATGNIYVAEINRIAVLNYRGKYLHDIDLSSIPDREKLFIQSIALDVEKRLIFIGENKLGRIIVLTMNGEFVRQFGKKNGTSGNIGSLKVTDEDMVFIDPDVFILFCAIEQDTFHLPACQVFGVNYSTFRVSTLAAEIKGLSIFFLVRKTDPHGNELFNSLRALFYHKPHNILMAEAVTRFEGVFDMEIKAVIPVKHRGDAALGIVGGAFCLFLLGYYGHTPSLGCL